MKVDRLESNTSPGAEPANQIIEGTLTFFESSETMQKSTSIVRFMTSYKKDRETLEEGIWRAATGEDEDLDERLRIRFLHSSIHQRLKSSVNCYT